MGHQQDEDPGIADLGKVIDFGRREPTGAGCWFLDRDLAILISIFARSCGTVRWQACFA